MTKRTEGPWKAVIVKNGGFSIISGDLVIASRNFYPEWELNDECEANAAFIATACNCHDELVEACKMLIHFVPDGWEMPLGWVQVVAQAQQAIAKAEGGEG